MQRIEFGLFVRSCFFFHGKYIDGLLIIVDARFLNPLFLAWHWSLLAFPKMLNTWVSSAKQMWLRQR